MGPLLSPPYEIQVLAPGQEPVVARRIHPDDEPMGPSTWVRVGSAVRGLLEPTSAGDWLVGDMEQEPESFQAEVDQLRRRAWAVNVVVLMAVFGLWQIFELMGGRP